MLISDGVVALRPITMADAEAHLAGEDDELARWLNGGRGTLETVARHIGRCVKQWEEHGANRTFAVLDVASGALAGTVDVHTREPYLALRQANLAYGIYPQWRKRGIATRAVELVCRYLQTADLATYAVIRVDPENHASAAVALRAGFVYSHHTAASADEGPIDCYLRPVTPQR
ncbi:GNAT family N-acetyltransferase [Nocardia brasiliensis]|uniref:GNAT family N-acetyltransferase n=1 Tax=Nocardia brasiliensis TaxID=37326 RepID=UPI0004A70986|nr:GNAT family N-acetyltransferase [Nocardia brasiliensis]